MTPRSTVRRAVRGAALALLVALALGFAAPAGARSSASSDGRWPGPDYQADRAGHPLRILAYMAHPLGVAVDYAVMRPCYWIGQHEPFRTLFGVRG